VTALPSNSVQGPATDENDVARAIALLSEGFLTRAEFQALTGIDAQQLPQYLTDAVRLAGVQRAALQLRNSGALARLEALRHARDAVEVAAQIMRDSDAHASNRLTAAAFIAKISGTQRPVDDPTDPAERVSIKINIGGDHPPILVDRVAVSRRPLDGDLERTE
jgi:hypothetical protein